MLQEKMGKITSVLSKKGIDFEELPQGPTTKVLKHEDSLELDEFVSKNMRSSLNSHAVSSPLKPHHQLLAKTTKR